VSRAHDDQGDCRLGPRAWWWMGSGPVGTSLSDSAPNPVVLRSSSAPCTPEDRAGESKKTIRKKSRLSLTLARSTAAGVFVFLPCSRPPSPASPARCPWAPLSRAVAMQPLCRGRKRQVLGAPGRTKKTRFGLRCARARVLRTSPVGRGGGRRQAGQDHSDGEQGDDGRVSHPARRGGLAYAAANTRKATEEMEEQEEPGLACSKTLCRPPSAAESWFRPSGGDSNEIASRRGGRCFAGLLPYPWYGHVPRVHVASIGCADHARRPESSPAAPSRPAPYAWDPRSRDGGGAARPPGPGVTLARASAESGRPLASR
jgi:hypothetical protein